MLLVTLTALAAVAAVAIGAPMGADHDCPAGASVATCHYPPHPVLWAMAWAVGGGLSALVLTGMLARWVWEPSPRSARHRGHLMSTVPAREVPSRES